ncbi:hypothetical protein PMAYCL1PPCAC_30940, partial [Pristionchus mayeri]
RQMWDLDPEEEKRLANRSIWIRGLGLSAKAEYVLPLLERTGDKIQRLRIYKLGTKDRWGEFIVYATYRTEEAADLNRTRLCSMNLGLPKLKAKKAGPEGAYRPLTEEVKKRLASKNMTKADRMKLIKKKEHMIKLHKIRQKNQEISEANGSPSSQAGN